MSSAPNAIEIQDLAPVIGRAIQHLPEAQQEVIDLSFFKGMSQREIAAEGKISLGTDVGLAELGRARFA
jgi:DNA-directed RNA polymerase specialized sigma24 family protein